MNKKTKRISLAAITYVNEGRAAGYFCISRCCKRSIYLLFARA